MAPPTAKQWKAAVISGGLLLAGGNGAVVVAVQWVPSGLAALLVGSVPLWIVLVDWVAGARVRPSARSAIGVMVGFAGIALLAGSPGVGAGGLQEVFGVVLVLGGALSWAVGSIYSKYAKGLPSPGPLVSMQMLAGGGIFLLMSLVAGEPFSFDPAAVSAKSALSLLYLITFGAMVAYAAYMWLLTVVSAAKATTYAYVNPVVAMFLGWALADEPLTFRSLAAAAIILGAVVLITTEAGMRPGDVLRTEPIAGTNP
jgi:drug/metabolite transporter (DMT)-like permease